MTFDRDGNEYRDTITHPPIITSAQVERIDAIIAHLQTVFTPSERDDQED